MELLSRHVAPALGRSAPCHDGRSRLCESGRRLAQSDGELYLVTRAQHSAQAHRTSRRALLHRAGAHAQERQALRMGRGPRVR